MESLKAFQIIDYGLVAITSTLWWLNYKPNTIVKSKMATLGNNYPTRFKEVYDVIMWPCLVWHRTTNFEQASQVTLTHDTLRLLPRLESFSRIEDDGAKSSILGFSMAFYFGYYLHNWCFVCHSASSYPTRRKMEPHRPAL